MEEDLKLIDTLPSNLFNNTLNETENENTNYIISQLFKHLSEKEMDLIKLIYWQGQTINNIAEDKGKNPETIRVAHLKILNKLKNILKK